jgi:hypothetical protein
MSNPKKGNNFLNIAGAATTLVRTGGGTLKGLTINKAVASGVITIYDNTSATSTLIATITHPATLLATQYALPFDIKFSTGLTVVTSAADDITVVWNTTGHQ